MPPNLDSPSGTLEHSTSAPLQLDQLEATLRRLQRDTLKIKKRNETVLDTLRREKKSGESLGLVEQNVEEKGSWESGEPSKPPRTSKFFPEVAEILRQSEEMRKIMQEEQKKNEEHLGRMRAEGDLLSDSLKKFKTPGQSENQRCVTYVSSDGLKPYKTGFGLLNGVKSTFTKALDRLNYSKLDGGSAVTLTHCGEPAGGQRDKENYMPQEDVGRLEDFTDGIPNVKTSTPKAKPRVPKCGITGIDHSKTNLPEKSVRPKRPPPPVPVKQLTIETLKEMYQNVSEEEATLSLKRPPVPKPRPDKQSGTLKDAGNKDEESNSGLDESSSEFDFVLAPLKVEIMEVTSDDSEESLRKNKGFVKNPQLKSKGTKELGKPPSALAVPKKSCLKYSVSPAPTIVVNDDSFPITNTCYLPSTTVSAINSLDTLEVPAIEEALSPPPSPVLEYEVQSQVEKSNKAESGEITSSSTSLSSALIHGRRICPVNIEIHPWASNGRTYDIYVVPKTFPVYTLTKHSMPEEQHSYLDFVEYDVEANDEKLDAVSTISRSFSFLDDDCSEEKADQEKVPSDSLEELVEPVVSPTSQDEDTLMETRNLEEIGRILVDKEVVEEHILITEVDKTTAYFRAEDDEVTAYQEETTPAESPKDDEVISDEMKSTSSPSPPPLPFTKPPAMEEYNSPVLIEIIPLPIERDMKSVTEESLSEGSAPPPPPPPAMPEIPLFCSIGKTYRALPVTPLDDAYLRDSIFGTLSLDLGGDNEQLQSELKLIEGQFNKSATEVEKPDLIEEVDNAAVQSSSVSLLSQKRRNAVAICTKQLKNLPASKIVSGLKELNTKVFSEDDIQILTQIIPKEDEKNILETVDRVKSSSLCKEDHFLKQLSEIPRCAQKLEVMTYILGFDETIKTLERDIGILESATNSVKMSSKFPKILEVILIIVNTAFVKNEDERVRAFEIQSLLKLGSKKSSNGKGSLLNFIAKCVETNFPDALAFYEDFKQIEEAARISKEDCQSLLKDTEQGLQSVRDEIDMIQLNGENLDYSDGVSDVISFVINATKSMDTIIRRWEGAIKLLKQLMTYLGVTSSNDCNIKEFFGLISKFISDFKLAVSQNQKLFALTPERQVNKTDSSLALRRANRLSLGPNELTNLSAEASAKRRQSLGNFSSSTSALQKMQEETGQPSEFIDAVIVFGQKTAVNSSNESEKSRIRRRASLYTPCPYRKRVAHETVENRERT